MNRAEAYKILGLESNASEEQVTKAFRKRAAKLHPDQNKAPDAEQKFKELNQAYQTVTSSVPENFEASFEPSMPIRLAVTMTMKEAILGQRKEFTIQRDQPCVQCDGQGATVDQSRSCKTCNGTGIQTVRHNSVFGNVVMRQPCETCHGQRGELIMCVRCHGAGLISESQKMTIPIYQVVENQTIRIPQAGHMRRTPFGFMPEDILVDVVITSDPAYRIENSKLISDVSLTLLEALQGITKQVSTVRGDIKLKIPARSRHRDQIKLPGYGIHPEQGAAGAHYFELSVEYPVDSLGLIPFLEQQTKISN